LKIKLKTVKMLNLLLQN